MFLKIQYNSTKSIKCNIILTYTDIVIDSYHIFGIMS